jgi:hypothetical protein
VKANIGSKLNAESRRSAAFWRTQRQKNEENNLKFETSGKEIASKNEPPCGKLRGI